jgi:hypothetical protein
MTEKRINQRFGPLVIKASLTHGGAKREGYLTNVSIGGAFLALDSPPPLGAEIDLSTILPWRLGELRATARVVWRSEGGEDAKTKLAGAGLLFTRLDADSEERLTSYLARFAELAAQIEEGQ